MSRTVGLIPTILAIIVIISLSICKYFNVPKIFLLIVIITCILYQIDANRKGDRQSAISEKLIGLSKFIIISGVLGIIVAKVVGLFISGPN